MDYHHTRKWVEDLIKECCVCCPSYRLSCLREIPDQGGYGISKPKRPSGIIDNLCPCEMVMRKFREKAMYGPEGIPNLATGQTTECVETFIDDAYRAFGAIWRVGGADLRGLEPGNKNPNIPGERSEPISEYSNERLVAEYASMAIALSSAGADKVAKETLKMLRDELLYRLPVR